jgi:hypothetical protein
MLRIFVNVVENKYYDITTVHTVLKEMFEVVQVTKCFYAANATNEIIEHVLCCLDGEGYDARSANIALLSSFIPSSGRNVDFQWVDGMFLLWNQHRNSIEIDKFFIFLFHSLAYNQRSNPTAIIWSESNIQMIFATALRSFEFPMGDPNILPDLSSRLAFLTEGGSVQHTSLLPAAFDFNAAQCFSKFIVYTIDSCNYTLEYLEILIKALELFCHPSHSGDWTTYIFDFLLNLTESLLLRHLKEGSNNSKNTHDRIARAVLPLLELGSAGKDPVVLDCAQHAIKNLAWLCPSIVFPEILPTLYQDLTNLMETHRTLSALAILCHISPALVRKNHCKFALDNFIPLLDLSLAGIGVNDPLKTNFTFFFISHVISFVPMDERFIDWIEKFLESIFLLFQNLCMLYS